MRHDEQTDAELLAAAASGNRATMNTILGRYAAPVTRYAWALVGSQADVEEAVQDTFLVCWQKAESIVLPDHSLLPWLLVTCRNMSMNLNRSRFRHSADELPDDLALPVDDHEARDRLRWVMTEIEQLSPLDKQVCELCLIEGRSYADAASTIGISVGAVRQRVSRSRSRLRKAVADNEN